MLAEQLGVDGVQRMINQRLDPIASKQRKQRQLKVNVQTHGCFYHPNAYVCVYGEGGQRESLLSVCGD
eukprot:m.368492 g.368492  ORF g.368492 m.368492 type:complete len:68 (+) comp45172_c0_seq1:951-1154(+)